MNEQNGIKEQVVAEVQQRAENQQATDEQKNAENARQALAYVGIMQKGKGKLRLEKPLKAASREISELSYDFAALTGWECVTALDSDPAAKSAFHVTNKQALHLFAASAAKETLIPDDKGELRRVLDSKDIVERIAPVDAIRAMQQAAFFFNTASNTASQHITSAP